MLANANWGGMLHPALRRLTPMEAIFLAWLRPLRRRFFCAAPRRGGGAGTRGAPAMAAILGTSVIAPCASGLEHAMRWEPGKSSLPHRDHTRLRDYVSFVLPGKVRLPKGYTQEQLRAAILAELQKHTWSRERREWHAVVLRRIR